MGNVILEMNIHKMAIQSHFSENQNDLLTIKLFLRIFHNLK